MLNQQQQYQERLLSEFIHRVVYVRRKFKLSNVHHSVWDAPGSFKPRNRCRRRFNLPLERVTD